MKRNVLKAAAILALISGVALTGCKEKSQSSSEAKKTVVKVGVTGSLYNDVWAPAKESLKSEGIDLQIVQFSDYATPNSALDLGELDLTAQQHRLYLANAVSTNGYKIESIANTFLIPLNLYSLKYKAVNEIKAGSVVAIPNDASNGGRALKLLEKAGLIKLGSYNGLNPQVTDIAENISGIVIKELSASTIPSALQDVDAACVNGNYGIDFNIDPKTAIFFENPNDNDKLYWCTIVARTSDLSNPERKEIFGKVIKAFQSEGTKKVFKETFGGYFIPVGWDEDQLNK